jgi:hypothetical protein
LLSRVLWAAALIFIATMVLWAAWRFLESRQARGEEIEIHRFEFHPKGETPKK